MLDGNDAAEATEAAPAHTGQDVAGKDVAGKDVAGKLAALLARREAAQADLARLAADGQTQLSRTDADARLLSKTGQTVAGYNVQIAVDDKHKLIVANEVVNDGNDTGQLHAMAQAACEAVGVATLRAVADTGYFNGETLKACEDSGIEAFVPEPRRGLQPERAGRFGLEAFAYDAAADVYRCPAGELLRPMPGRKLDASGKSRIRYASRRSACARCPLRPRCLAAGADRRVIERWEHQAVIERHRMRMAHAAPMMRCRKALAEHPFGTLKCRAGYRHFLMRGFAKVRGECSLMVLCYNFTQVLSIIGIDRFIAWLAKIMLCWVVALPGRAAATLHRVRIGGLRATKLGQPAQPIWLARWHAPRFAHG
jgi:Transposase DDE domain